MPLDISSNAILEKNKLNSSGSWLLLIKFTYQSESPIRLCLNNDTITWDSVLWHPAIFSLSGITETKNGDIPSMPFTITDFNGFLIPLLEQYDGAINATVDVYVVHSGYLNNSTPEVHVTSKVISTSVSGNNVISFQLGGNNLSNKRCPDNRYLKNTCRFSFKDERCGYSGSETVCDRTFARCTELNNLERYGGFIGVGTLGYLK